MIEGIGLFKFDTDIGNKVAYAAVVERIRPELEAVLVRDLVAVGNGKFGCYLLPSGVIGNIDRTDDVIGNSLAVGAKHKVSADGVFVLTIAMEIL